MHTAEHIFNQSMVRKFGIERSFSNHIEKKKSKCDYNFQRNLSAQEVTELEREVNKIIEMDLSVTEEFINISDADSQFNLSIIPKDTSDKIRVIKIGDYDSCLCAGDHVSNTSEIGNFKIISTSHDNNILRVRFRLIS